MTYGIHKYWVMNNGSVIHDDFAHEGVVEPFILDYHHKKIDKPDWIVG